MLLKIPVDFISVFFAAFLAYFIRPLTDLIPFIHIPFLESQLIPVDQYLVFVIFSSALYVIIASLNGLYSFNMV